MNHDFFKTGDSDAPNAIKDPNGEVVLQLCRVCGQAEAQLTETCPGPQLYTICADEMMNEALKLPNAHQIAASRKPSTVGELMQYLTDMQAVWTAEDERYLGKFEDMKLCAYIPKGGIADAKAQFDGCFGLILFPDM